jgi:hypothetical protein
MVSISRSSLWYWVALCSTAAQISASGPSPPVILRIRKADGSIGKIQITNQDETTLSSILSTFSDKDSSSPIKCSIGTKTIEDTDKPLASFELKNGSLITIAPPKITEKKNDDDTPKESPSVRYTDFDPYPDLARSSHSAAARRNKALARLPNRRSMSYSNIADLHSYMHVIEPQTEGALKRVYMCSIGAQRFNENCTIMPTKKQLKATKGKAKPQIKNRCAILFGTVNKERVDQSVNAKARTSLSTPLYEMNMCDVAKVHTIWEPPQSGTANAYDASKLITSKEYERAVEIAEALGMRVIGWIYSYADDRQKGGNDDGSGEDSLPVFTRDIVHGAKGQVKNMQKLGHDNGQQYLTLALDSKSGAAEAFQLSNVSVQMVAEGVLVIPEKGGFNRFVQTRESISVDNKETKELDSVLCLINTAMLSHEGRLSGKAGVNSVKKEGGLTAKKKKVILDKIEDGNDGNIIDELCDFSTIMALDRSLSKEDLAYLCKLVVKYSKGMRKGIEMDNKLKLVLKSVLAI